MSAMKFLVEFLEEVDSFLHVLGFGLLVWLAAKWLKRHEIGYSKDPFDQIQRYKGHVEHAQHDLDHWKLLLEIAEEKHNVVMSAALPVVSKLLSENFTPQNERFRKTSDVGS